MSKDKKQQKSLAKASNTDRKKQCQSDAFQSIIHRCVKWSLLKIEMNLRNHAIYLSTIRKITPGSPGNGFLFVWLSLPKAETLNPQPRSDVWGQHFSTVLWGSCSLYWLVVINAHEYIYRKYSKCTRIFWHVGLLLDACRIIKHALPV